MQSCSLFLRRCAFRSYADKLEQASERFLNAANELLADSSNPDAQRNFTRAKRELAELVCFSFVLFSLCSALFVRSYSMNT